MKRGQNLKYGKAYFNNNIGKTKGIYYRIIVHGIGDYVLIDPEKDKKAKNIKRQAKKRSK